VCYLVTTRNLKSGVSSLKVKPRCHGRVTHKNAGKATKQQQQQQQQQQQTFIATQMVGQKRGHTEMVTAETS
jgi:hypothetical protein